MENTDKNSGTKTGGIILKIYIENQTLEFNNEKDEVTQILMETERAINQSSKTIYSMVIDDVEVFSDYDNYFLSHIKTMRSVKVNLITYKELVIDTLESASEYLKKAPDLIEVLANSFYNTPDSKAWNDLSDLLGGIDWILGTYKAISDEPHLLEVVSNQSSWSNYADEVINIKKLIPEFEESMVNKDNILIADILSYEIKPTFKKMEEYVNELVK